MILYDEKQALFHIRTAASSYLVGVLPSGQLVNLHYGAPLAERAGYANLRDAPLLGYGNITSLSEADRHLSLDHECLEASPWGRGDYRRPSLLLEAADGDRSTDFRYCGHRIRTGAPEADGLPTARSLEPDDAATLEIDLRDAGHGLCLTLVYGVFPACDVITRSVRLRNDGPQAFRLHDAASFILDLDSADFLMTTLNGAWIREHHPHRAALRPGIQEVSSIRGASGSSHDPFLLLERPAGTETAGECYGFSLVYSGNHSCQAEVSPHGLTRVRLGINATGFSWLLEPGAGFDTPQGVLCFSAAGRGGLSRSLHRFVRRHIVRGVWRDRPRPVLVNSWEACYFRINERNLLGLARSARRLGVELFVMDDGWFGHRDDDTSSLGDWTPDPKKLPGGLDRLVKKVNALGLDFGIWIEPEMVNRDSRLYREHPDWLVRSPAHDPSPGRNQYYLDLTRADVREWLVDAVGTVLASANISYVKWDMNRNMADWFSPSLGPDRQGEFVHRYFLGLYEVMGRITAAFPGILFESCASGGNRFDYGMMCYMPQVWASDDSDAIERLAIQSGASLFAPPSVIGAHVSAVPNHQVMRDTPLESRFNTAAFGLLGYELDFRKLSRVERQMVARQIAWYKDRRRLLQFGEFHRLIDPAGGRHCAWLVLDEEGRRGLLGWFQTLAAPNQLAGRIRLEGLRADGLYRVTNRPQFVDIRQYGELVNQLLPVRIKVHGVLHNLLADNYLNALETTDETVGGDQLMGKGFLMKRQFYGAGNAENLALVLDFGSRIFELELQPDGPAAASSAASAGPVIAAPGSRP